MTPKAVWEAIDFIAEEKRWSMAETARRAGIDQSTIKPCKRVNRSGQPRFPDMQTIVAILDAAGVSFTYFAALLEETK